MRTWIMPVVGASLVLFGIVGLAATTVLGQANTDGGSGPSRMDAMFIEQMIPHHEDAIAMAEIAEDKAEHVEIKRLAADIRDTQSAEIEQMRGWYEQWLGGEVADDGADMMDRMMGGDVDLDELETAQPFDKAFIEEMIPHHQMGVMMARMMAARSDEPEMRDLAERIIESQTREIEQMQEWYAEWYEQ